MEDQVTTTEPKGKGQAIGSLVCGIASFANAFDAFAFFLVFIPVVLGIVSLSLGKKAVNLGYEGNFTKVGKIFAILGIVVSCVICFIELIILIAAALD